MKNNLFNAALLLSVLVVSCSDEVTGGNDDTNQPMLLECMDGLSAGNYPCRSIDLVAHVGLEDFQGEDLRLNDIWGWTDPETGKEYALVGMNDGVSFVDISTPTEPIVIGKLEESILSNQKSIQNYSNSGLLHDDNEAKSAWRDFKVYKDHLFVVSDIQPAPHGMQVFDLNRLRGVENPPEIFTEDYHYQEFGNAHNIAINEETGYAYVVGSDTYGGGLHIIDIQNPLNPQFAGFHQDTTVGYLGPGYVHDTQCVIYRGTDSDYQGDEICFNSSESHFVIANVTDKDSTYTIAKSQYEGVQYAHQGWLTEDQQYFLLDDELDEDNNDHNTRTYIWDVSDLDNPEIIGTHTAATTSIDHNQYVKRNYVYQANYTAGLRILNLENIASGQLEEVAYFDTQPQSDSPEFEGAWSNYPFFDSGIVVVSDISEGLFILKPDLD